MIMHWGHLNSQCDMWKWGHKKKKTIKRLIEWPSDRICKRGTRTCKKSFFFFFYPPFCWFLLFSKCIFINKYFPFSTSWLTEEGEGDLGRGGECGGVTTLHIKETVKMKSTKEQILCRKRGKCVTKYHFPIFCVTSQ